MKLLIEESVLRQALEALDYFWHEDEMHPDTMKSITALRTAIEQAEKVEPVAWMYNEDMRGGTGVISFDRMSHYGNEVPLYTAPAVPSTPLSFTCPSCGRHTWVKE